MKFGQLEIENFLAIGEAKVRLDDRGLNVIQGVNDDSMCAKSNGAGKSSIVDALCWCLYGVTARGVKADGVVNRTVGKNTRVSVDVLVDSVTYKVTRHRKHSAGKNTLNVVAHTAGGGKIVMDKGTEAETQKELEKILGCSQEVFMAAVYAGQELMPDLPRMGDRDLKRLIEEAAGLQRIERAFTVAKQNASKASLEAGRLDEMLKTAEENITYMKGRHATLVDDHSKWEAGRRDKVLALRGNLAALEKEITLRDAQVASLVSDFAPDKLLEETLKASLSDHDMAQKRYMDAVKVAGREALKINRGKAAAIVARIKEIQEAIAHAPAHMGEPCKECGKPHTPEDLAAFIEAQNKALATQRELAVAAKAEIDAQVAEANRLQALADAEKAKVPDVSGIMKELERIELHRKKVDAAAVFVAKLRSDFEHLEEQIRSVEAGENPFTKALHILVTDLDKQVDHAMRLEPTLEEANKKKEITAAVVKVFGPAGVRARVLDTVTPYLNDRTAIYLGILSGGEITATWTTLIKTAKGELKEKFSIDVTSKTGGADFASLSGGEKRKVRLATALALQDLVASRASQPIECWIGDEVDDALDSTGLENLMVLLEVKAREKGTVIVISHNDLSDWADQITTVTKKGGLSVVEGSLTE